MLQLPKRIIVSASSDIGHALTGDWLAKGCEVHGTYRTRTAAVDSIEKAGAGLVRCDLADEASIAGACAELRRRSTDWDVLVLAPGAQDPVGPFLECDFASWAASINVNFTSQMRWLHELLPVRRRDSALP